MVVLYRHVDRRHGFTWSSKDQPPARWHGEGQGPVQYLAGTPDGAWAEFLRHEEIVDTAELDGIERRIWAVDVPDGEVARAVDVVLEPALIRGGADTYRACQHHATQLRDSGAQGLRAPSAALDAASGYRSENGGLVISDPLPSTTYAMFGQRTHWTGWMCHDVGRPHPALVARVRSLTS